MPIPTKLSDTAIEQILRIATDSEVARLSWKDRGVAPVGYVKGMAVVYARVCCNLKNGDDVAAEMAKPDTGDGFRDALAWYGQQFLDAGMDNSVFGVDVLRHLFVLLVGLGMRESSGRYCEGRDRSAQNVTADTAEAGLFQVSFNARRASPLLPELITRYEDSSDFVDIFREGVRCRDSDLEDFGEGEGREFQRLTKACPAFAVEFAAVGLRNVRTHWGPINARAAELRAECDEMFMQIQAAIDSLGLCS